MTNTFKNDGSTYVINSNGKTISIYKGVDIIDIRMKVSEVLDIDGSFERSTPLKAGEVILVQKFNVKFSEEIQSKVAEIQTTKGLRYSFAKTIVGQAESKYWIDTVQKAVDKDASDGLEVYVITKEAEGSGREMLALSMYEPKTTTVQE